MNLGLFELPQDFSGDVRIFPLPDLVLFPRNVQPLHIFESRYQEMMQDALNGDHLITIATLARGFEPDDYAPPPVAPPVCIGRIVAHERNADGTFDVLLAGVQRAMIGQESEPIRSFRQAKVNLLFDEVIPNDPKHLNRAKALTFELLSRLPEDRKIVDEIKNGHLSLAALTDILAFQFELTTELKLELLSEVNPFRRGAILLDHLPLPENPSDELKPFPPSFSEN